MVNKPNHLFLYELQSRLDLWCFLQINSDDRLQVPCLEILPHSSAKHAECPWAALCWRTFYCNLTLNHPWVCFGTRCIWQHWCDAFTRHLLRKSRIYWTKMYAYQLHNSCTHFGQRCSAVVMSSGVGANVRTALLWSSVCLSSIACEESPPTLSVVFV